MIGQAMAKLGVNTSAFERGLNSASGKMQQLGKMTESRLTAMIAPAALFTGLMRVVKSAQDARDRALEIGEALDASTAAAARLGDSLDRGKSAVSGLVGGTLRFVEMLGEQITADITALFSGGRLTSQQILEENRRQEQDRAALEADRRKRERDAEEQRRAAARQAEADARELGSLTEKIRENEYQQMFEQLTLEEQIEELQRRRIEAQNEIARAGATELERNRARLRLQELTKQQEDLIAKGQEEAAKAQAQADAEAQKAREQAQADAEKLLDTLKEQRAEMERQADTLRESLRTYERQRREALNPTQEEVLSGRRNIGSRARRSLRDIARADEQARRESDRVQRIEDRLQDPNLSAGDRARLESERQAAIERRERALGRGESARRAVEGRVQGIETNVAQLRELEKIKEGIDSLNTKLEAVTVSQS